MGVISFGIISGIVVLIDLALSVMIFIKKDRSVYPMAVTMFFTAEVAVTYFVSIITTDYFVTSLFSSLYFSGISAMVLALLYYISNYTGWSIHKHHQALGIVLHVYAFIDIIIQLLNPFWEISIHYVYRPDSIAIWKYEPKLFYQLHLVFCYLSILMVFAMLIQKAVKTPKAYRPKYLGVLWGLLFIVGLNAIFLFFQNENVLDISILFYSLLSAYIYWDSYLYSQHNMLNRVRQMILDELEQPVFLFDSDDKLAMRNDIASEFIPESSNFTLSDFASRFEFPIDIIKQREDTHFQWNYAFNNRLTSYRVDFKILKDHKNRVIGTMIVMADTSLEMDILTGFHSKSSFEGTFRVIPPKMPYPVGIAICDINKLTLINRTLGKQQGDIAIQHLSKLMKKHFPADAYFARLEDANLLAVCPGYDTEKMRGFLKNIHEELDTIIDFGLPLEMQCAVSLATKEKPDILEAKDVAMFSVRSKKLLDGSSAHSSLLDSLAQTLLESDDTTRAHVERTKNMGEKLGKRLGFTDAQQSELALLCLLHDIGKLGIPLEILNKPGKLNSAEWDVMKSHVEKGYRIAQASNELKNIADLIRHHHESWNGKGYPDGLKQEAIPLLSRVIAVVDTYDAMTNDRPYHKAISDAEARKELRRCSGVQFDPKIVAEFLEMLNEMHPITEEEAENLENTSKIDFIPRGVSEVFGQESHESINVKEIVFTKYQMDENWAITNVDDNFELLTGYSKEDVKTYRLYQKDIIPNEDLDYYYRKQKELALINPEVYIEHRIIRKDGSIRNVACFGKPVFDSVTRKPVVEILVFDLSTTNSHMIMQKSERESAQRSLNRWESLMRKDSLTNLLNHESFINDVEIELLNPEQKTVLIIMDVDYFKNYNDSYGHLAGDRMLSLLAVMLETSVKDFGFSGRLGGDEFGAVIKMPVSVSDDEIDKVIKNIFTRIYEAADAQEYGASISMGAAYLTENPTFNKLYQAADRKLYQAKENGRKCYKFLDE